MWPAPSRTTRRPAVPPSRARRFRPRLEALEGRWVPSAGALDPTFGSNGLVTIGGLVRFLF